MIDFYGLRYKQGNQNYISAIMPMGFIIKNYKVLIYGAHKYGYQRAPKKSHYNKIAKEIESDISNNQVTPSSVILGANLTDIKKMFKIFKLKNKVDENKVNEIDKKQSGNVEILKLVYKENCILKLRVIDGQHRIKGFEKARDDARKRGEEDLAKKIEEYNVNVIIMLSDQDNRKPEVQVFSNINSKAKPLKMDLTILAEYEYDLIEKHENISNYRYIAVSVVKNLNKGKHSEGWLNGIFMDAYNDEVRVGCVGFKTFYESILPICKIVCDGKMGLDNKMQYKDKKKLLEDIANEISKGIGDCWDKVFDKWDVKSEDKTFDGEEFVKTFYNKGYYLQRTMGVLAINYLIVKSFKDTKGYIQFKDSINKSNLTKEDWVIGGRFSGMSSLSGVSKIKKLILNV